MLTYTSKQSLEAEIPILRPCDSRTEIAWGRVVTRVILVYQAIQMLLMISINKIILTSYLRSTTQQ